MDEPGVSPPGRAARCEAASAPFRRGASSDTPRRDTGVPRDTRPESCARPPAVAASAGSAPGGGVPALRGPESSMAPESGGVPAPRGPESSEDPVSGGGVPAPRGPESCCTARARQRALAEASMSSSVGSSPRAIARTHSASAPQISPSPTRTLPGASAPSRSPHASTSRTSARVSLPGACGCRLSGCQCRKAKQKNSGLPCAHQASSLKKHSKAWRKPPSGGLIPRSKPTRARWPTSRSANWRTCWAKPCLLP